MADIARSSRRAPRATHIVSRRSAREEPLRELLKESLSFADEAVDGCAGQCLSPASNPTLPPAGGRPG